MQRRLLWFNSSSRRVSLGLGYFLLLLRVLGPWPSGTVELRFEVSVTFPLVLGCEFWARKPEAWGWVCLCASLWRQACLGGEVHCDALGEEVSPGLPLLLCEQSSLWRYFKAEHTWPLLIKLSPVTLSPCDGLGWSNQHHDGWTNADFLFLFLQWHMDFLL